MVRRDELPVKIFMPWTVPQVHSILSDSVYLSAFHKESNMSFGVKIEPWEPPGSELGFVRKRRCVYTAPSRGPAWFKTMLGGPNLVEMLDIQEMMYDPESGCMVVHVDSFMLLDGGASNLRMRHTQWLYQPVMIDDHLEGCEVKTTFITDGASCRNAQLHDLPLQVEDALAGIAKEEAARFNNFALYYIGSLEEKGQLISPDQALHALMSSSHAQASSDGPCTPGKHWDVPFTLVSGALVYEDPHGNRHRNMPASHHRAVTTSPAEANSCSKMAQVPEEQPGSWAAPRTAAKATEKLMTGPVLEGVPAAGKEVDDLLGTELNALDLATAGRSLRIKTWRSHTHDSGMSMRPFFDQCSSGESQNTRGSLSEKSSLGLLYGQRSSQDSQDTRPASADNSQMGRAPHGPDKTSITAQERLLLEQLAFKHGGEPHKSNPGKPQLSPKERRMVNEILSASMEADDLTAQMGMEAGTGMHYHDAYQHHAMDHPSHRNSFASSSEYSVSTVGTVTTCAAPSPSAIRIYLTPRGGRTFSFAPPQPESEKGSVLRGTALRSGSSYHSMDSQSLRSLKPEWQEEPGFGSRRSMHLQAERGAESEGIAPIQWVPLSSAVVEESGQPQHTGQPLSPMSNSSWQPLSDVGRQDEDDLFPENLMLTEQSDLGLLRNQLAQVLPEENLNRQVDSKHAAGQPSRNGELQGIRDIPAQHSFQHPSLATDEHVRMQQAANGQLPAATEDLKLDLMETGRSDDHTFKPPERKHQLGPQRNSTPSIVETVYWDAQDDLPDADSTLSVQYLRTLDDAENHDMHTSGAGVLHTSLSIHTTEPPSTNLHRVLSPRGDTPETARAMADVMSVAIETVNECAQTAMTTVNRITQISLEQLQAASHTSGLSTLKSSPLAVSSPFQGDLYSQHSVPLSADIHPPTSVHPLAPSQQRLVVRARPAPPPHHDAIAAMRTAAGNASASMLAARARDSGFSLEGELHSFRQAGLGRRGAGSEPPFRRGPTGGPMSFGADIPHPSARLTAEEMRRRALHQPLQRRDTPAMLDGRPKVKVPPLWTGSSPFEGRLIETVDSDAFSEAQEGMQWVNGKGWVQAEKNFLESFDSAPPRLRRLESRPPPLPDIVLPARRPSPAPEKSIVSKPPSSQAAISSGLDSIEVVQQASREHLLAERRRRATKLAKRGGAPSPATDTLPPPRVLPKNNLPTAATQADKASRRRSKGGLCGKLADFCGSLKACRPSKTKRAITYSEANAPQISDTPSSM
ncbi:hypothetical protein COCOBI_05-1860 [Coccomyxa sp. Obi]|nr:hypothetical protein COCOBI_05-1860 [Coccomyxa sp. Obi]